MKSLLSDVKKGDCIFLTCEKYLSKKQKEELKALVKANIPDGVDCLVLDGGIKLNVIRKS